MFKIIICFPISDLRKIRNINANRLNSPDWPTPQTYEFMRSSGQVFARQTGGLDNWVGEYFYSKTPRAFRFYNNSIGRLKRRLGFKAVYFNRRFFFDGNVSGRYEFFFRINDIIIKDSLVSIINEFLKMDIRVIVPNSERTVLPLGRLRKKLESHYLYSSSKLNEVSDSQAGDIKASNPFIIVEDLSNTFKKEISKIVRQSCSVKGVDYKYCTVNWNNQNLDLFYISNLYSYRYVTDIEKMMVRTRSNSISLNYILSRIKKGEIAPQPFSPESDMVQLFLNKCISNILKYRKNPELDELTRDCLSMEDALMPGARSDLLDDLETNINIRKHLYKLVKAELERLDNAIREKESRMGGTNNFGDVNNSNIVINSDNVTINQSGISEEVLADLLEMVKLIAEKPDDFDPEKAEAVKEIAEKAMKGDKKPFLEKIKPVGKWLFDTASKLGLSLLTAYLKTELGY